MKLHHVQVSMPAGEEALAGAFYGDALGLTEVEKPPALAGRGGCWFRAFDEHGATVAEIHVGVDEPFTPQRKAHPALLVDSLAELEAVAARIEHGGFEVSWADCDTFAGYTRFHARDGFGNRVEVMTPAPVDAWVEIGANGNPLIRTADDAPFTTVNEDDLRDALEAVRDEGVTEYL